MVILVGETLGKRQQDLNKQVRDAMSHNADFEQLIKEPNSTDVDVLFKIDLASKYKNVDYILETLKSGDSLYISRALKCTWLFQEEYSNFINTDYLHHHIFPSMSFKMKKKVLTIASLHIKNEERAESFYTYCVDAKFNNIAVKFLIFTSESFKINVIKQSFDSILHEEEVFFQNLVGKSFSIAVAFMNETSDNVRSTILYYLRYLISVDENEYLNMLEKYDHHKMVDRRFGLRITKQILKKHRNRCVDYTHLYMERLNKDIVMKYTNVTDAKYFLAKVLPGQADAFWRKNFCIKYDFLLKKIPAKEKFMFIKKIFNEKYLNEEFEMSKSFFHLKYYDLMTVDEREAWALRHIENNSEFHGVGRHYLWYEHVNFEQAFPEIKRYILKTPDFQDRHNVVLVLIKTIRKPKDIQTLLTYYYDRHVNELAFNKNHFICRIVEEHNVFEFDNDCWTALNKLLHSTKVYKSEDAYYVTSPAIILTVIMYHIIHKIDLPDVLKKCILESNITWRYDQKMLYEKVKKEDKERIYEYITNLYVDEITKFKQSSGYQLHKLQKSSDDEKKLERYIHKYIVYLEDHDKTKDDCHPEVMEVVNDKRDFYESRNLFKVFRSNPLTEADLMRQLKKDSKVVIEKMTDVRDKMSKDRYHDFKVNNFLKKLKIYFTNDIAKEYFNTFSKTLVETELENTRGICSLVYGIFQLADDQAKIDFLTKYAPAEAKIAHGEIDELLLSIREGICRSVCFSRPPVPVQNVLQYIKGDYLRFCLPMFQSYQAKLPQPLLQEFVSSLLDAPVSVQKHALRLVFECFSVEELTNTVRNSWKRTKNISLRHVLYESLYNKVCNEHESAQGELFEVLKMMCKDLKEDDHIEIFQRYLNNNQLPTKFLSAYIKICWQTVSKFLDKTENYRIKTSVIENIARSVDVLDGEFVREIAEEHVNVMLVGKNIIRYKYENDEYVALINAKWKLVATYIIYFASDVNFVDKNMDFTKSIVQKCIDMWSVTDGDHLIYRKFCFKFVDDLLATTNDKCCGDAIPIFETILTLLKDKFPLIQIYRTFWSLKLSILRRKIKQTMKINHRNKNANFVDLLKTALYDYGLEVGNLVKEYVGSNNYFVTANSFIVDVIKQNVNSIMWVNIRDDTAVQLYANMENRFILAAGGLTDVLIKETYLIALDILPVDSENDVYEKVMNKIKDFANDEVQYCLYDKFVNSDFKRRKIDV